MPASFSLIIEDDAGKQIVVPFAKDVITKFQLPARCAAVLMSPVHGVLDPRVLSEWMLEDHLPARLQLQLHKLVWAPDTRGV